MKKIKNIFHGFPVYLFFFNILFSLLELRHSKKIVFKYYAAGIADSISEILETIKGIASGIQSITSAIAFISSFFSLKIVVILFIIFAVSSGLASLGIAKGKTNFLLSLFLTDVLWFIWSVGYYQGNFFFVLPMLKSNILILSPFILVYFLKRYSRSFYYRALRSIYKINGISVKNAKDISDRFVMESAEFQKSFNNDIYNSGTELNLSHDSLQKLKSLKLMLNEIYPDKDRKKKL